MTGVADACVVKSSNFSELKEKIQQLLSARYSNGNTQEFGRN
jgi:hypothetical protein